MPTRTRRPKGCNLRSLVSDKGGISKRFSVRRAQKKRWKQRACKFYRARDKLLFVARTLREFLWINFEAEESQRSRSTEKLEAVD